MYKYLRQKTVTLFRVVYYYPYHQPHLKFKTSFIELRNKKKTLEDHKLHFLLYTTYPSPVSDNPLHIITIKIAVIEAKLGSQMLQTTLKYASQSSSTSCIAKTSTEKTNATNIADPAKCPWVTLYCKKRINKAIIIIASTF